MRLTFYVIVLLLLPHVIRWRQGEEAAAKNAHTRPDKTHRREIW